MHSENPLALIQILEKTISPDQKELEAAKQYLDHAANTSFTTLIKMLSDVLVAGGNSQVARTAAGLQLKNHLTSKDLTLKLQYQQRWLALPEDIRLYIKKNILAAIGTENSRPSSAAECVAYVAMAELPVGQWNDLIPMLVENVCNMQSTELKKEATLEAIGYICQAFDAEILTEQSNPMLTAIIHGMRSTEPSNHVRLAATQALLNSLELTEANIDKGNANSIMEVVREATRSTDMTISVAALQCLIKILSLYYQYMEPYIAQALFPITLEAMKSDVDEISLQGIEFWSDGSDEDIDRAIMWAQLRGRPELSRFHAKSALQYVAQELMRKHTKQDDTEDELDWNPSKVASICLMFLSNCEIVPQVLPFISSNIKNENWRYREAALMAFSSILDGLEANTLKPLVEKAMPTLIEAMCDSSVAVRHTAAWTLRRICEIVPEAAINETYLKPLLESLVDGLKAKPRVAANVCWTFIGLAEAAYEAAERKDTDQPRTYCMSNYFDFIIERLLETTDRQDGAQHNLRLTAYEALMKMVKNSPTDCYVTVQKTMVILERLQQVLQMKNHISSQAQRSQFNELQHLLCATLQLMLPKMTPKGAPRISDAIMTALLTVFAVNAGKAGGVQEDALMTVSTVVEVLGDGFLKYMEAFKSYLYVGLNNHQENKVCFDAVELTRDIYRALKNKVLPYCDEIILLLLENLGDPSIHRSVKPPILQLFGDIAISIGPDFVKYFDVVMHTLLQASKAQVDRNDYDMVEYLGELRESVLQAYSGIILGLKGPKSEVHSAVALVEPHVPAIVNFMSQVACEPELTDDRTALVAGLAGDLCQALGRRVLPCLETRPILDLLQAARRSRTPHTKKLANWATKEIRKLKQQQTPLASW